MIRLIHTYAWDFGSNTRLAWHSPSRGAFIAGNHSDKRAYTHDGAGQPEWVVQRADPYELRRTVYDDRLPETEYRELAAAGVDGFTLLSREEYDAAFPGEPWGSTCPVDQALISGLTNELPVRHPASGAVVSFSSRRVRLYALGSPKITVLAEAKASAPITAVRADPARPVIYYGTNAGDVFALPVEPGAFGRQKKILSLKNAINSLAVSGDGATLYVGRLGYVSAAALGERVAVAAEAQLACRAISLVADRWLLVNQGMHGISILDAAADLKAVSALKPGFAIDVLARSADGARLFAISTPLGTAALLAAAYGE